NPDALRATANLSFIITKYPKTTSCLPLMDLRNTIPHMHRKRSHPRRIHRIIHGRCDNVVLPSCKRPRTECCGWLKIPVQPGTVSHGLEPNANTRRSTTRSTPQVPASAPTDWSIPAARGVPL